MNLTGSKMYSKAISPLRNTSAIGKDVHLQLVFVYPMLFDSSLQKYKQTFRDFISNTFLREIFTSNFLNLVKLTNQISPLEDENGNKVDLAGELGVIFVNQGQGGGGFGRGRFGGNFFSEKRVTKEELQQKIKNKTEIIKNIMKSDPVLKTLNPKIEFVTLENMIDVPVIVGTKPLDLDSFTLAMFLFFAIALKLPIDSYSNVKKIIQTIKHTDKDKLLNILKVEKEKTGVFYNIIKNIKKKVINYTQKYTNKFNFKKKKGDDFIGERSVLFPLLDTFMTKLDELDLYFRFMLDEVQLKNRYGMNYNSSLETTVARVSPHEERIFRKLENNILNAISSPIANLLRSYDKLFAPINNPEISFEKVYHKFFAEDLANKIHNFILTELRPDMINFVKSLNVEQTNSIKTVKSLCSDIESDIDRFEKVVKFIEDTKIHYSVKNGNQEVARQISKFVNNMDSLSSKVKSLSNKMRLKLNQISPNYHKVIADFEKIILDTITDFINEYVRFTNGDEAIRTVEMINPDDKFDPSGLRELFYDWINYLVDYTFSVSISVAICEYVKVLDVEIETAKNEVTDFPNYTLVLPEETLYALYTAYTTKNFKQLLMGQNISFASKSAVNLSSTYTKSMVRYINKKLRVPNLIVINQRSDVHYKLMNLTDVNKTKITTIETFNKLKWKSNNNQQSNYFAY